MSYYDTIHTGGDSSAANKMTVYLYPFPFSDVFNACGQDGDVAGSIRDAAEELLNFGAIDYYEVLRFKINDYRAPDQIDPSDDPEPEFKEYLEGRAVHDDPNFYNGTGDNLLSLLGVHQLIHDDQVACDEDDGYAPAGANAEPTDLSESAFETGLVAWSPVCSSNDGLTKNASIQECLHLFISREDDAEWTNGTWPNDDQHSLGKVSFTSTSIDPLVTPMLTYHWDDEIPEGDCVSETETPGGHQQALTECTKKAVRETENTV